MKIIRNLIFLQVITICLAENLKNYFKIHPENALNLINQKFIKKNQLDQKETIKLIQNILIHQNEDDKLNKDQINMLHEISRNFIQKKYNQIKYFDQNFVNQWIHKNILEIYMNQWIQKMYDFLIKEFKLDYGRKFLAKLLNNPQFYGLSYESYKLILLDIKEIPSKGIQDDTESDKNQIKNLLAEMNLQFSQYFEKDQNKIINSKQEENQQLKNSNSNYDIMINEKNQEEL